MNNNKVTLIDYYGGDKAIARAAWTSTQIDINNKTDEQIGDLIKNKLWNNKSGKPHKTPFERGLVEWNITLEQASHIHALKHRLANINGESARYMELKDDKFYLPADFKSVPTDCDIRNEYNKNNWYDLLKFKTEEMNMLYHKCLAQAAPILGRKRAKESARFFKTMNSQIVLSVMMNMSCFNNFYHLRSADDAQEEIQEIAEEMLQCIKNIPGNPFKHTLEAMNL